MLSSTEEEWLFTSTPASLRRCITSLLSSDCSRAISYTRLLIRSPTLYLPYPQTPRLVPGAKGCHRTASLATPYWRICVRWRGRLCSGASSSPRLALGLYVYLPVCKLHGEPGVLALAADGQGELVVGYDHLSLLLILVQVDFTYARRAQGLRYKACRLRVPLDDVDLLVPELGDHSPYAASPRPNAGPDGIHTGFLGPHGHLRAQPGFAGDSPYLDEAVVDLGHF